MRSGMLKTIIVVSFLLISMFAGLMSFDDILVQKGSAAALYVYPGGNVTGNYSSIQMAIDNASAGDTIYVWAGTYTENVLVNKTVTLIGNSTTNTTIDGSGLGNVLLITADWVNVSGFTVKNSASAFGYGGIHLYYANNCNIENNNASGSNRAGIFTQYANNNTFHNNTANFNAANSYGGIHLRYSNNNTITSNNISYNYNGLLIYYGENNTIINNTILSNDQYGLNHGNTMNSIVMDNIIQESGRYDLYVYGNTESTLNNTILNNTGSGDRPILYFNSTVTLKDTVVSHLILANADNSVIENVTIMGSDTLQNNALYVYETDNSNFRNINSTHNLRGADVSNSPGNDFENNNFSFNKFTGVVNSYGSYDNIFMNNTISWNEQGVDMNSADNVVFINNSINYNANRGLMASSSDGLTMTTNKLQFNGMHGIHLQQCDVIVISNNSFASNGEYGFNSEDGSNGVISDNDFQNGNRSIYVVALSSDVSNNSISNNIISNASNHGIYLSDGGNRFIYDIVVTNNVITNATIGINLTAIGNDPNNIMINRNKIDGSSDKGITLNNQEALLYNISIFENNITNSYYGIHAANSNNNSITYNNIINNTFGIYLINSKGIMIYYNNIIDNANQSYDNGTNAWNAPYPTGGNYWSDYTGADNFTGPGQNLVGRDGFGDTNYSVIGGGGGNADEYPLMHQVVWWTELSPVLNLISPTNDTLIQRGDLILFDIWDSNYNIKTVNYTINGGFVRSFGTNYIINTSVNFWWDQTYDIQVNVEDMAGNIVTKQYTFHIDMSPPVVWVWTPYLIRTGTVLDFWVSDPNLDTVTYSVNGGPVTPFTDPYNISTDSWTADGNYSVFVTANDTLGQLTKRYFNFTVDNTKPMINLISPSNNSVIMPGTNILFDIMDDNLLSVNYTWGSGSRLTLLTPYSLMTYDFVDGDHTAELIALDSAGNVVTATFTFTFDSIPPMIMLNSPADNSIIKQGTTIDLSVIDTHIDFTNFTVNGGVNQTLALAYDIDTTGWSDDLYTIEVFAHDLAGHMNTSSFTFTLDSTPPSISVISPPDGTLTKSGVGIQLSVTDTHLIGANYTINDLFTEDLVAPYVISTNGWSDFDYTIEIKASDLAGNINSLLYNISLDSTRPLIELNSPEDGSEISPGTTLDLSVTDVRLVNANYTVNGGTAQDFTAPYDINTTGWADGEYTVTVSAIDSVGNFASQAFTFTVKKFVVILIPEVLSIRPGEGTMDVPNNTTVTLSFSLEMNRSSVESGLAISPSADIPSYGWNENGTELTLTFSSDLKYSTTYNVTLAAGVLAVGGGQLAEQFASWFSTKPDTDDDGLPDDVDTDDDGDGLPDSWEFDYALNRLDPTDAAKDDDSDELSNLEEYQNGTNPKEADSDSDGLTDGAEVKTYLTDPVVDDSDGDGYKDGDEVDKGSDPLDPLSMPIDDVEPEEEEEDTGLFGLGPAADYAIILVIIIIIIVVLLMVMKMRKKEEEPVEEESESGGEEESEETSFECPECGAEVTAGETICPECGVELEQPDEYESESVGEEESELEDESESAGEEESELEDESESAGEEESGEESSGEESEDEGEGEEGFECPDCGATLGAADTACPECGAVFEEESELEDEGESVGEEESSEGEDEEEEGEAGLECPGCGANLLAEDTACPECGNKFDQ